MSDQLRGIRAAERFLRDPLKSVEVVLAADALPARLTLETDWLSRSPLAAVPLPARDARSESAMVKGGGARAGLVPPVGGENKTDRSIAEDRHAPGARARDAAIRPAASPPTASIPIASGRVETRRGAPPIAAAFEPHRPMHPSGGEHADGRPARADDEGGPVISLRRIGANAGRLTTIPEQYAGGGTSGRTDRAARDTPTPALSQMAEAAPRSGSVAPTTEPPKRPERAAGMTASQGPVLGAAIDRVSTRAVSALARRHPGSSSAGDAPVDRAPSSAALPDPIRSTGPRPDLNAGALARRSITTDGLMLPAQRYAPGMEVGQARARVAATQADPDWVLEVIGEALADQARREGIDLA